MFNDIFINIIIEDLMKWNILVIRGKKNKKKYFVSTGEGKWKKKMKIFGAILYEIINEIKTS